MATHKPFRELIPPGTNFEFMGRAKLWFTISGLLIAGSIAMLFINKAWRGEYLNWSTDFKGGTELIFGFNKAGTDQPVDVHPGDVRKAFNKAGYDGIDVSDFTWEVETSSGVATASGILVRTRAFGAVPPNKQAEVADAFVEEFKEIEPLKVSWSGDRMYVRSKKPVDWEAARAFLADEGLKLKPWSEQEKVDYLTSEQGTGEVTAQLAVEGIDAQYRGVLQEALGKDIEVRVVNVYGVGAKAGAQLRNDGIISLFYALILVALYLFFRFDIRYVPGAIIALIHDAVMVVGVFAVTWTEFSLTTVAAILTIIGYSVNDTVVIYDRIRENVARLKDKKFQRIMNISINETLARTMLTGVTVFGCTIMMNVFGTGLVRNFAFAMNIGIVVGMYSSIFIASPLVLWIHNRFYGRKAPAPARTRRSSAAAEAEDEG